MCKPTSENATQVLNVLEQEHPDARIYLEYDGTLDLLVRTILAAQCTDEKVNEVAPRLWDRFPTAARVAKAPREELEEILRPTGFYRRKSKSVQNCCHEIVHSHNGEVPDTLEELTALPGVGRKTANVVLAHAFGQQAIPVDTHVKRVSRRIGLAKSKKPDTIEKELQEIIPEDRWTRATELLGTHGRRICESRNPDCESCPIADICDYASE
ncbi:MAG: endonuclease III [Candidatus Brocadiia bacterium]